MPLLTSLHIDCSKHCLQDSSDNSAVLQATDFMPEGILPDPVTRAQVCVMDLHARDDQGKPQPSLSLLGKLRRLVNMLWMLLVGPLAQVQHPQLSAFPSWIIRPLPA